MKVISIIVSILFVTMAILHVFVDAVTIDSIAIILLVLASLPWLFPYLKSLELPGGVKIELKDIKSAVEKVSKGENEETISEVNEYAFLKDIAAHDSSLALVAIRIEIEKSIRNSIGEERHFMALSQGISKLVSDEVITRDIAEGLRELIQLGNKAAHGVEVESEAALYVIENASKVLTPFKEQLANAA